MSGRAAVVLRDVRQVALIRRVRDGHTFFDFPGGEIRTGEQPADTALREAREELGVQVVLGPRLLIEEFRGETAHYYSAVVVGGELGSGSDEPTWMELSELPHYDVRPRALASILTGG
ncbi:MAG TPA: NUDIX domain-containing protein [Gaiellaceae bacterium]|nr:NUDIX domain-containing protein [Gaiellaceae bacterium]